MAHARGLDPLEKNNPNRIASWALISNCWYGHRRHPIKTISQRMAKIVHFWSIKILARIMARLFHPLSQINFRVWKNQAHSSRHSRGHPRPWRTAERTSLIIVRRFTSYLNHILNDQTPRIHHQNQKLQDPGRRTRRVSEGNGCYSRVLCRKHFSTQKNEETLRPRNVTKLLFINMSGQETNFGQMECLKLITANSLI